MAKALSASQDSRPETILAALLYLMTHYQRTRCPWLAECVSRHMACLSLHPQASPAIRGICAGLRSTWETAARAGCNGARAARRVALTPARARRTA